MSYADVRKTAALEEIEELSAFLGYDIEQTIFSNSLAQGFPLTE